jgi:demethylmenaquinone methyltransferase/2-methoxy-6-polyprenyl-1,4-benzoquinol methylase
MTHEHLLSEMIDYYKARASEYDQWFMRQGRYDHGEEHAQRWWAEVAEVQAALAAFEPRGQVLELASGTGWWTEQLVRYADRITAVDTSAETIGLNKQRVDSPKVEYVQENIFEWRPAQVYDVVFFSFWLSHVPPERFDAFWALVAEATGPDGRVFFVDSRYNPGATAAGNFLKTPDDTTVTRKLNDGRSFEIVKIFYEPKALAARLNKLGWQANVRWTDGFFLYGTAEKT